MNYRERPEISQSELKRLISGRFAEPKESSAMQFGSLVDCLLTTPDLVDEQYAIIDQRIGDKPKMIVDDIIDNYYSSGVDKVGFKELDKDYLQHLMDKNEYRSTYKDPADDRRFDYLYRECVTYYNNRLEHIDKTIIDQETFDNAIIVRDSILHGTFTSAFHDLPDGCETKFQLEIYFTADGFDLKGMLDYVIINHNDSPIMVNDGYMIPAKSIVPIDYKVITTSTRYFNLLKFRYDIQGSFYRYGLKQWMLNNALHEYELCNFHFIVGGIGQTPYVHVLSNYDEQVGEWGGRRIPTDKGYEVMPATTFNVDLNTLSSRLDLDVLGWRQALYLYRWYQEYHAEMQYDKEAIENGGIFHTNAWAL